MVNKYRRREELFNQISWTIGISVTGLSSLFGLLSSGFEGLLGGFLFGLVASWIIAGIFGPILVNFIMVSEAVEERIKKN